MTKDECIRSLELFGIPSGNDGNVSMVREQLAVFLEEGEISLAEAQLSRDIAERSKCDKDPFAFLFLAAMFRAQRQGNAFLSEKNGEKTFQDENGNDASGLWEKARDAAGKLSGEIVVHLPNKKGWFFARNLGAVDCIVDLLRKRTKETVTADVDISESVAFDGVELDESQKEAVKTAVSRKFAVIVGGPGTGKTTIVCSILRQLLRKETVRPEEIALAAPTGRAAQRMTEALREKCAKACENENIKDAIGELKGTTIHSLLGGRAPNWKYTAKDQLPHKLVVVDESSMVDIHLMRALLEALRDDCRLVLLGDSHQLPSVDTGAVLGDLASKDKPWAVELKETHRFDGSLKRVADVINGENPNLTALKEAAAKPLSGKGWTSALGDAKSSPKESSCSRLEHGGHLHDILDDWAAKFGLRGELVEIARKIEPENPVFETGVASGETKELFDCLNRSRILTVLRRGKFGAEGVNNHFSAKRRDNPFDKPGVPVLITRNSSRRNLYNGDIGVTVLGAAGVMYALFPRGEEVVSCPVALLPEHELAYAITIHKAQGSQFENVLMILPDGKSGKGDALLSRELIYTGITRAEKRAVICGSDEVLNKALATHVRRDTGIEL